MGQALYRKYRSKKLSEIVGQEHVTRTLERALKTGKISHAYLFTGPKGVGKTSIARILAHEINALPYTDESIHLDIIEIDAASNRRIDEIRDLREKVHIAPTSAKYKVYIIDEVHMLTKEAFNALLKTLEEPPAHVVFMLATTELHKLPETIISRTQRFTLKPIDEEKIIKHLAEIAKEEGMEIDNEALRLLAIHGRGGLRDSISLLDQVGHSQKTIAKADAEKIVGLAANEHIESLMQAALRGTPSAIISALNSLITDGISPAQTAKQLAAVLRLQLIDNVAEQRMIELLGDLLAVQSSTDPAGQLEVALFKANLQYQQSHDTAIEQTHEKPKVSKIKKSTEEEILDEKKVETNNDSTSLPRSAATSADWWNEVLQHIKTVNNTLYGMLRMAQTSIEGDTLHLRFGFIFHKKKADDTATQSTIKQAIKTITGKNYTINAIHDKTVNTKNSVTELPTTEPVIPKTVNEDLTSITNIFGGGEVLDN